MSKVKNKIVLLLLLIPVWIIVYKYLQEIADFIVFRIFQMAPEKHMTETLRFFIYEVPKVMMLLVLIIFIVGIIRTYFSPEKTRKALEGKSLFTGNVMAALLGILTPFCSCSAIPLFLGFVEAGIPLGVTFSFLIAAPMINEVMEGSPDLCTHRSDHCHSGWLYPGETESDQVCGRLGL